ncbi:protein trichome birefringence-like 3 [Ipomoea triloba]|uniref:protein trichome birefringence-like 3 n=1 Tax=Ipomoea triloba TaxID=35885 RepID=UPI00125CF4DC|nr:protein trichome birefringence-like 3 [Ipomoea triloba]
MAVAKKPSAGKSSLLVIAATVCSFAFVALLYTERISLLSPKNEFRPPKSKKSTADDRKLEGSANTNGAVNDGFKLDPDECSVTQGKWVFNRSIDPLYSDRTCRYIDRKFACVKNGRKDSDYLRWVWQPDDCTLPSFDPEIALRKIKGKRVMFVGDSLQRNQWESFICLVDSVIPKGKRSMKRGSVHSVYKAKEYDATIEFYWAPYLVESNTDIPIKADADERIIKVDSIAKRAEIWVGADILVFNTYVWWMTGLKIKSFWGSFGDGEEGYESFDAPLSYRLALRTWANWIDSAIDHTKTRVFFTTMSPAHQRSEDWGKEGRMRCYNETSPVTKKGYWGSGSDKEMMKVVESVVQSMKVPVTLINITQLSEYRVDAHSSVYSDSEDRVLSDDQKAEPWRYADCIHWCLPGLPDTWNRILYAYL